MRIQIEWLPSLNHHGMVL